MASKSTTLLFGVAIIALALLHVCDAKLGPMVTCGSVIKLQNKGTGYRLHSHDVAYATGSRQQSVTAFPDNDDTNSYWMVRGSHSDPNSCTTGKALKNGDVIRLMHLNTQRNLHSHWHNSPLSGQQEVSCWGQHGQGDSGDDWEIVLTEGSSSLRRDMEFGLKHRDTGLFLHSHNKKYGQPIAGQLEVTAHNNDISASDGNVWMVNESLLMRPKK